MHIVTREKTEGKYIENKIKQQTAWFGSSICEPDMGSNTFVFDNIKILFYIFVFDI